MILSITNNRVMFNICNKCQRPSLDDGRVSRRRTKFNESESWDETAIEEVELDRVASCKQKKRKRRRREKNVGCRARVGLDYCKTRARRRCKERRKSGPLLAGSGGVSKREEEEQEAAEERTHVEEAIGTE